MVNHPNRQRLARPIEVRLRPGQSLRVSFDGAQEGALLSHQGQSYVVREAASEDQGRILYRREFQKPEAAPLGHGMAPRR